MSDTDVDNDPLLKEVVRKSLKVWGSPLEKDTADKVLDDYSKYVYRKWVFIFVCIALIILVTGYALTVGDYPISMGDCYMVIWEHITGHVTMPLENSIIFELRLPRVEVAVLAGIGLAIAGVVMQSTLMNPLADSYTTGVSSGAGLGATIAVVLGWSFFGANQYAIVVNAFIFSLIPMLAIVGVSKAKNSSPTTMIMAGIAIMYLFGAFTTVLQLMTDPNKLAELYQWGVGSLGFAKAEDIPVIAMFVIPISLVLFFMTNKLNALASGDESAKALGIDAEKLRRICLVLVALLTAAVVSFTGTIGFVGLVAPHIVRIFVGADNRYLLPASAVFGALILLVSDLIGRTIIAPAILQVGVVMAFLGGPMFLWLIMRKKSNVW